MYNWDYLSITRFFLAFIVFSGHLSGHIEESGILKYITLFGSFEAIIGFLLISGFSIGKSILKNQDQYFIRRAQRIYPVYLSSMILHFVLFPVPLTPEFIGVLFINVLFLNQFLIDTSYVGPAWSLALEVWLYSLAPFFLKLSYKILLIIIYVSFFFYCLYTCCRSLFHWPYYAGTMFGINVVLLSFIWIAGFVLAVFKENKTKIMLHIAFIFIAHFGLVFLIQAGFRFKNHELAVFLKKDLINYIFRLACLGIIYYVVLFNHRLPELSIRAKKVFNFLGNISYPLYLIHLSIIEFCIQQKFTNWMLLTLICLTAASLIYLLVDFYSQKRKIA
ncbi:MAG TPA: acyltransferase [Cytophaga sp.]|jgi:peptidoglycan/LPS O-acetylase OafA/YrhL|nr:acyltransferase [Cytophaga sp.]